MENSTNLLPLTIIHTITLIWRPIIDFDWQTAGLYYVYFDDAYCEELYFDGIFFIYRNEYPFLYVDEMQAFCKIPDSFVPDNMPYRARFDEQKITPKLQNSKTP